MAAPAPRFPWEYLCQASQPSLQSFELTRLNHAANLRKEIAALVDEWMEETAAAMLARWLLEHWSLVRGSASPQKLLRNPAADLLGEASARAGPGPRRRNGAAE